MENMYFLAITPSETVSKKVIEIQQDIASRFQSQASLKIMPHITLKAPFRFPENEHESVLDWFSNLPVSMEPFRIELKNFGAFPNRNKPVLFISPEPGPELMSLQKQIIGSYQESFPLEKMMNYEVDYHPHLTVAFRDLQPASFEQAWAEFKEKEFNESFQVSHFHLLQHQVKQWQIIRTRMLGTRQDKQFKDNC
jgi:2'-5' RNA ligase